MEHPIYKWMIWGYPILRNLHVYLVLCSVVHHCTSPTFAAIQGRRYSKQMANYEHPKWGSTAGMTPWVLNFRKTRKTLW